ncbi:hypothetical protein [Gymnodinialimonas sp.]
MGEAFPVMPILDVIEDDGFWALAEMVEGDFIIRVPTGIVTTIDGLWRSAIGDPDFAHGIGGEIQASAEDLTHVGLVWLMLHELHHYEMGHFKFVGRAYLTETFSAHRFAIATRSAAPPPTVASLNPEDAANVEPCLEMQADHDAIDMLLDAYSPEEWSSLRARVTSIAAIMMLIELADAKPLGDEPSSHPKAATRIFQLLGHVVQMPLIQAMLARRSPELGIDPMIPSKEEQAAFRKEVVIPCFLDAVNLARVSDAEVIREDLGEPEDFFSDVGIALSDVSGAPVSIKTAGAAQWANLMMFNDKLLGQH